MSNSNGLVVVDKAWFEGFNVVLMAFSLTFVVHINCLVLSVHLVKRNIRWWPGWLCLLQAATAMACHTSRLTDFFFATDCTVKPYHNYTMFWISCCTIDLLLLYSIAQHRLVSNCSVTTNRLFWLIMGALPTLAKSAFMILTIISMQPITGPYGICSFTMNTNHFHYALAIWAIHHFTMLILTSTLPLFSRLQILPKPKEKETNPQEPVLVCFQHVISICLITLMFFPNPDLDLSDLVMQSYWAIKSRTAVSLLLSHEASPNPPSAHQQLIKKSP